MPRKNGVKKRSRDTKTESKTSSGQFQQSPTIHLSTNPNLKKKKAKRNVYKAFSKIQNKTASKGANVCSSNKQKPSKTSSDIIHDCQSSGENALSGTNVWKKPANRKSPN